MFLLPYPVETTRCGAAALFIQNIVEKENINQSDLVYIKTKTKPFEQNIYFAHFLEGLLSPLHSSLVQESRMFRKPCKMNASSTFKKHVSRLYGKTLSKFL